MELLGFITDNWLFSLVILIAISVVVKIIKDMIKALLLALVIVLGFLAYVYYDTNGTEAIVEVSQERQEEIRQVLNLKLLKVPVETVQYGETKDGRFTVQANGIIMTGTWSEYDENKGIVKVKENGQTIELPFTEEMKKRVAEIKAGGKR